MTDGPTKKRRPDWAAIRREYEAGGVGLADLASRHPGVGVDDLVRKSQEEQWRPSAVDVDPELAQLDERLGSYLNPSEGLTPRLLRFVEEYLIDLDAKAALVRAGYAPVSAAKMAGRVLDDPKVKALIDLRMAERAVRTGIKADRVVERLAAMAFANVTDVVTWGEGNIVTLRPEHDLDPMAKLAIRGLETRITKDGINVKVVMHDQPKALELLMKHLGLFRDTGPGDKAAVRPSLPDGEKTTYQQILDSLRRDLAERAKPAHAAPAAGGVAIPAPPGSGAKTVH